MSSAAISGQQKKYVKIFEQAKATRLNTAKRLKDLGISDSMTLKRMISKGLVVKCQGDKYYLNLKAAKNIQTKKSKTSIVVFFIALIILLVVVLSVI